MKLNELLASQKDASNRMVGIEDATEDELRKIASFYAKLAAKADCNDGTKECHSIDEEIPSIEKKP
jgi:low affinity Fe/Cu permease